MTVRVRPKDLRLPKYMTKGGPGDLSMPGNVNTTEWWRPENMSEHGKKKAAQKGSIVGGLRKLLQVNKHSLRIPKIF